jgi:hypothetical protein
MSDFCEMAENLCAMDAREKLQRMLRVDFGTASHENDALMEQIKAIPGVVEAYYDPATAVHAKRKFCAVEVKEVEFKDSVRTAIRALPILSCR